ncbi:MAG: hypothetical protein ACRC1H_08025 [Caldilineaceae bacterium]
MVVATLILAFVLSFGALAWVVWPLLNREPAPVLVEDDRLADLLGRKDAVLAAIRDLEFDYKVGKIDEEDYQRYDARLRRQAIALIQQIEQVAPSSTGLDASVEAEVTRRRRVTAATASGPLIPAAATQFVGAPPAARAVSPNNGAAAFAATSSANGAVGRKYCTNCGGVLDTHHRFCATCGTPVQASEAPVAIHE